MVKLNTWGYIAAILLIIGGLNWGIYGLTSYDIIDAIFGLLSVISRIIYILVGISAIYFIVILLQKPGQ